MAQGHTTALTILLVTDSPAEVDLLQEVLHELVLPVNLHVVAGDEEALAFLRHEGPYAQAPHPAVLFLNLDVPGMAGEHVVNEIERDPALRGIPVVLFSGAESPKEHLIVAGLAAAYLTHSLERGQFLEVLGKLRRYP
jgi:CheY-like chemotaxis protein